MPLKQHAEALERLYEQYNRPEYIHPDPLEFVLRYRGKADREIAGLVASCLAYGRVAQILRSVGAVLDRMDGGPARFLAGASAGQIAEAFAGFRHRFCRGEHLSALLIAVQRTLQDHGSLEACFAAGAAGMQEGMVPALAAFVATLSRAGSGRCGHLLPDPRKASACKRLNLFLRWMVRRDGVDGGVWSSVSPARLIVPLDTHMHRLARALGATSRRAADLKTALEITAAFAAISPADPVRYDFALTRLGIHPQAEAGEFLRQCGCLQ